MFYQRKLLNAGVDMTLRAGFGRCDWEFCIFIFNWYIALRMACTTLRWMRLYVHTAQSTLHTKRQNHLITCQLLWFHTHSPHAFAQTDYYYYFCRHNGWNPRNIIYRNGTIDDRPRYTYIVHTPNLPSKCERIKYSQTPIRYALKMHNKSHNHTPFSTFSYREGNIWPSVLCITLASSLV